MSCRFLLLLTLAVAGCAPATLSVSGKVSYQGRPIDEGAISFEAPDGSTASIGGRIEKGSYTLSRVPVAAAGKKVVRIFAAQKTGRKIEAGPPSPAGTLVDEIVTLPAAFNEKSTLSAELTVGKANVVDFDLPADQPRR